MKYYIVTFVHTKIVGWTLRLPAHVAYLNKLLGQENLQVSGPFVGTPHRSAMLIFSVKDRQQLDELVANDPYSIHGLVAESSINEWNINWGDLKKNNSNTSPGIKYFVATYKILKNTDSLKYADTHAEYLKELLAQNKLRVGGSYQGNTDEEMEMDIFSANNYEEAEKLLKNDPYMINNQIVDYTLTEWNPRFGEFK